MSRSLFHLKTGVSHVGEVTNDIGENISLKIGQEAEELIFSKALIHKHILLRPDLSNLHFIRNTIPGETAHRATTYGINKKTRKMIILGAGASFDFSKIMVKDKPPMTNNLFEGAALHAFPGAQKLRSKILSFIEVNGSLEEYFEEKWKEIEETGDLELLYSLINAQFFIQDLFRTISRQLHNEIPNNYATLVEHIRRYHITSKENVAVVTFNYDTLFENAMTQVYDWRFNKIDDYVFFDKEVNGTNRKPIMLFKPHGSWNWIHRIDPVNALLKAMSYPPVDIHDIAKEFYDKKINYAQLKFAVAPQIENSDVILQDIPSFFASNFEIVGKDDHLNFEYYPNLLIPFKFKDESLMPLKLTSALAQALGTVEEILIIGWKGTEHDFNTQLKNGLAGKNVKVTYVAPNSDTVEKELLKYVTEDKVVFERYKGTFSQYLEEIKKDPTTKYNFFKT